MPLLLDLFCGAGGAAMGYSRAGFDVIGVDLHPQPNYPWPYRFIQADAMKILESGMIGELDIRAFDAIHASPPCQAYSRAMKHLAEGYPELIAPTLAALKELGVPWVVENVMGAPIPEWPTLFGDEGLLLCGSMFGLQVQRHRLFQTSFPIGRPSYCDHSVKVMNPHNAGARREWRIILGKGVPIERTWREEMGVGWMNSAEGREAIPPVYTEYIGRTFLGRVNDERSVS